MYNADTFNDIYNKQYISVYQTVSRGPVLVIRVILFSPKINWNWSGYLYSFYMDVIVILIATIPSMWIKICTIQNPGKGSLVVQISLVFSATFRSTSCTKDIDPNVPVRNLLNSISYKQIWPKLLQLSLRHVNFEGHNIIFIFQTNTDMCICGQRKHKCILL